MDVASFQRKLKKHGSLPAAPKNLAAERFVLYSQFPEFGIPQYGRPHLRNLMRCGLFPASVQLSPNRVAWPLSELERWKEERLRAARFSPSRTDEQSTGGK
jgi:predicted DNA-binding transcriptional regulator AlpA